MNSTPANSRESPKVFISYSWTSDDHTSWVADLGERLMADGVDVVLDQWSLKHGHDVNAFMEQMVLDPSIKRVLIISDAAYTSKANARKGGVGTESQIISQEVYEKVAQEKFVPIVRERDIDGTPFLPVFLKGRMYIDFSDPIGTESSYDQLLRNIFDRPVRRKPSLGQPPSHLFDDDAVVIPAAQKARRFCEVVTSGKGSPAAAFADFCGEFVDNFEDLRVTYAKDETWCETLRGSIEKGRSYRNAYIEVLRSGAQGLREEWFRSDLTGLLERLLPYQFTPDSSRSFYKISEDNYKFLLYELFLYTVAHLIRAKRYADCRHLLDVQYVAARKCGGSDCHSFSFWAFNSHASSLEDICGKTGDTRRLSVMADLIHERADQRDVRFGDLVQADLICCLTATAGRSRGGWLPRTLVYANEVGGLELFVRATTEKGFEPLGLLLDLRSREDLVELLSSEGVQRILHAETFWHADVFLDSLVGAGLLRRQ